MIAILFLIFLAVAPMIMLIVGKGRISRILTWGLLVVVSLLLGYAIIGAASLMAKPGVQNALVGNWWKVFAGFSVCMVGLAAALAIPVMCISGLQVLLRTALPKLHLSWRARASNVAVELVALGCTVWLLASALSFPENARTPIEYLSLASMSLLVVLAMPLIQNLVATWSDDLYRYVVKSRSTVQPQTANKGSI